MKKEVNLHQLVAYIDDCGGIAPAARELEVRASTIKRLLRGIPLPLNVQKTISAHLRTKPYTPMRTKPYTPMARERSLTSRLEKVYRLYQKERTLEAVGRKMGLTRERIRQLLQKGLKLGLFDYKPFGHVYPQLPKEKLLEDYKAHLSLPRVAKINNISREYLHKLLAAYGVTGNDLRSVRRSIIKAKHISAYHRIKDHLGHHPTTAELQQHSKAWRRVCLNIIKVWGSFHAFREELNIPGPPSHEEQHRRYTKRVERVRQRLGQAGALSPGQIVVQCHIPRWTVKKILGRLVAAGKIRREGQGCATKYRLVKG